jgi:hypothetical protein
LRTDAAYTKPKEETSKAEKEKTRKVAIGTTEASVRRGSSLFIRVNGRGYSPL